MKLQVSITDDVDADLIGTARHYDELDRLEAGRELVSRIYAEIAKLPASPYRRRTGDGLSANYRRAIVKDYIIYYRLNEQAGYLLVYHVRYAGRRPLSAGSHRRLASEGEHNRHPLPPSLRED